MTAWTRAASLRGWREKDSVLWRYKKQTFGFDRMCGMGERNKRKRFLIPWLTENGGAISENGNHKRKSSRYNEEMSSSVVNNVL